MNRITKGYNYFYTRKPSKWVPMDTIWLHKWLEMVKPFLKEATDKDAKDIFDNKQ